MEDAFIQSEPEKKTNWILFILIFGIVIVLVVFIIVFYLTQKPINISQQELLTGKNISMKEGQKINFQIEENEEHSLTIDSVTSDSVTISIQSEKITLTLTIGKERNIDIDRDGNEDLYIKLEKIENNKPYFIIKKITSLINNLNNNQSNPCIEQSGVLCNGPSEQCPSGSQKIGEDFCCFGRCYDTSKTCAELGGSLVDNFNNCNGTIIGSADALMKGATKVCCIGVYEDKNSKIQCNAVGGTWCPEICSGTVDSRIMQLNIKSGICCIGVCKSYPKSCDEVTDCPSNMKCGAVKNTGQLGCVFKTCADMGGKVCSNGEACDGKMEFADIYGNNSYVNRCCVGNCISQEISGEDCESITQETGINFPCAYFVPVSELPSEYEIYTTKSGGYGVYEVPDNDVTLGPREGVDHWYSIVYSKGDEESYGSEGIHGFSFNVLMFKQGYNKTSNIEKIELENEQIQGSGLFEVQYLINGDDLLVIIPFVNSTESEIIEFKNKLQQML